MLPLIPHDLFFRIRPSARVLAGSIVGLALVATLVARWFSPAPLPAGLVARYYANPDWAGPPMVDEVASAIDPRTFERHPALSRYPIVSAEWRGFLIVHKTALQRFALKSDGGSWLWIGDRLVIDNGGAHEMRSLVADAFLAAGVYPIRVRYVTYGAARFVQLGQVSGSGMFEDARAFVSEPLSYGAVRWRELWPLTLVALWCSAFVALAVLALRGLMRFAPFSDLRSALADRTFVAVAVLGLAMSAAHLGYALPARESWSPDELDPLDTLAGSLIGFSDWNLRWPPMHLYIVAFALRPFVWAGSMFGLPWDDVAVRSAMFVAMRSMSLAVLGATLLLLFDAARHIADRRAAHFAVLFLALSPVVVHFGPLAHLETPHLFWMTASLWAWTKLARDPTPLAFALFGATVGFSLATKDQAYAFYLAAPLACLLVVMPPPRAGISRRVRAAWLLDPRLLALASITLAAFALGHGLPWHLERFVAHLRFMTGGEVGVFQMFPATIAGQLELAGATLRSFVWAAGVPLSVSFITGCAVLIRSPVERRLLAWLVPLVTYYVAFLGVILYVYDRFLIGALPIVALIGGIGVRAVLDADDLPRGLRRAVPGVLVGVAIAGAVAQNVAFRDDPRGPAAAWLAQHVACGSTIGVTYSARYVPALDCYDVRSFIASETETIVRWPDYLVLSEQFAERLRSTPSGTKFLERLQSGALGFARVFRAEARPPTWAPLYWEDRFLNGVEDPQTTLDKPLNAIEVWKQK